MPSQRPRASFEPIPPDFDLKALVESTANFSYVNRISCDMIEHQGIAAFEKLIILHVIIGGKPLVIDGFEDRLDPWTFTEKWLRDNCGEKQENAWDLRSKDLLPLTITHYLKNMGMLTDQFFDNPEAYKERKRQRVYLKDIDCPSVWQDKLREHIPSSLYYLNESTGDPGGPGAVPENNVPGRRLGRGIGRAGDLMSSLPADMRAENLMCYVGHEGTFTPAHREMCASLGQNIMVEASGPVSDDGKPTKPGSSIWFMTESKDRHTVSEYWLSVLGHDIEVENHFAQIVAWKKAPFNVYVVEQRPGDFILIPPLAPHQVWNRGTRTMKVAWNRTTVETLEMALNEALPRSRIVCRDEQYKNKAIAYYTLQKYSGLLTLAQSQTARMPADAATHFMHSGKIKQVGKDFRKLFNMYRQILLSEMFNPDERDAPKSIEYLPFDGNVTCAYCRGNIFNRFLSCPSCKDMLGHHANDPEGDPYDVCMDCYAMGRSCACLSGLKWVEQFRWKELAAKYETWRKLILMLDGGKATAKTPLPIIEERRRLSKKSLAEVCKEQLKRRPWKDVHNKTNNASDDLEDEGEEIVVNDDGTVKKVQKKKSKQWHKNNSPCHVCKHAHPNWKMAQCTTCDRWWCYGTLFRGWDKMPLDIMSDPDWKCPHCLGICFAGACKKDMQAYEPKGTLLGHDTRKVADVRSVEALVDFSVSNLNWLKDDDPDNRVHSRRLKRAGAEAEMAKAVEPELHDDDDAIEIERSQNEAGNSPTTFIDPALDHGADAAQREAETTPMDDDEFARRLQQANAALPSPAAMVAGAPVNGDQDHVTTGFSAVNQPGSAYPQPWENNSYSYPGYEAQADQDRDESPAHRGSKHARSGSDAQDNIAMTKGARPPKKPRLTGAGFRSSDLAGDLPASASKAKGEAQRQFEREKERKALDKAKAQGRFIMLQAAMKGKKRIVKMQIPASKLAQALAQQAAKAALDAEHEVVDPEPQAENDAAAADEEEEDDVVTLRSDIAQPKQSKQDAWRTAYERRLAEGKVIDSTTKIARVPVEKDLSYGSSRRSNNNRSSLASELPGAKKRKQRKSKVEFEEVDVGSDFEDDDDSMFVGGGGSNSTRDRRSLPGYRRNMHADEQDDEDFPDQLPSNFKEGRPRPRPTKANGPSTSKPAPSSMSRVAGKRPAMRPKPTSQFGTDGTLDVVSYGDAYAEADEDADADVAEIVEAEATNGTNGGRSMQSKRATGRPYQGSTLLPAASSANDVEEQNRLAKMQALQMYSNDA